ncbi:MAG: hypothetical protein AB9866_06485 [Syntrophobacteraceae bacterium]
MKRVRAVAEFKVDALHFSYCMTALCPFLSKYEKVIARNIQTWKSFSGLINP